MALSSMILRRASSLVLPLAIRAVGSPRSFHGAIATALNLHERTPKSFFQSQSSYSSAAGPSVAKKAVDDNLIRVINSGIKSVNPLQEIPKGFPFAIENNSVDGILLLTREEADERIKIKVDMTALEKSVPQEDSDSSDSESDDTANDSEDDGCEETNTDKNKDDNSKNKTDDTDDSCDDSDDCHDDGSDSDSDDNGEDSNKEKKGSSFPMTVSVIKGNGLALEFDVNASSDNIAIQTLEFKESIDSVDEYEGPNLWHLDPELEHAFHRYLEIRGIKPSMAEYLQKYVMNKTRKEELQWLKKLKRFIKK